MTTLIDYEIYLITTPGYWYVGSTIHGAAKRFREHMGGKKSGASLLKAKVAELGIAAFKQTVVETSFGNPIEAEQKWYDFYLAHDARHSLNRRRPGGFDGWNTGIPSSPEHRAKIGAFHLGRKRPLETGRKISAAKMGHTVSQEARDKISESLTGREGVRKGAIHTAEAIAKMSATQRSERWQCAECEMVTNAGCLAKHQNTSGHTGSRDV